MAIDVEGGAGPCECIDQGRDCDPERDRRGHHPGVGGLRRERERIHRRGHRERAGDGGPRELGDLLAHLVVNGKLAQFERHESARSMAITIAQDSQAGRLGLLGAHRAGLPMPGKWQTLSAVGGRPTVSSEAASRVRMTQRRHHC